MSNLEITIYGGIVVAGVAIFILTPIKTYMIKMFKQSTDNEKFLSNKDTIPTPETPKISSIASLEKTHSISFEKARKIAQEKSDAEQNIWQAETRARIEESLLSEAKRLLESGEVSTYEEAKTLAKELSDAELELWQFETNARTEKKILETSKQIIKMGKAKTFDEAKKMAKKKSDAEFNVWETETRARIEKKLLDETKKIISSEY